MTQMKMCWINWQVLPKMSLEIHWASLNRVHVAGWKCCSAWPTAKTYLSVALCGPFATFNQLWVGRQKFIWGPYRKISAPGLKSRRKESLLREKCRWCQKPFILSEMREHSLQCTGNFFGYSDKDATDLPAVMKGAPDSRNKSTQSSLNVPIFLLQHSSLLMYIEHPVRSLLSLHPCSVMYSLTPAGSSSKCQPLLKFFGFHYTKLHFSVLEVSLR